MSSQKSAESYDFYFPLYNLRNPESNIKVGFSILQPYENLPKQVRGLFLSHWDWQHSINNEFVRSKKWFIQSRKESAFLCVTVKETNWTGGIDQSFMLAKASVGILSFLYCGHFPILDSQFVGGEKIKGGNRVTMGSSGEYYYRRSLQTFEYDAKFEKEISLLTNILTSPKSEIDSRIINTLSFFDLQSSLTDKRIRFVLLATCLESYFWIKTIETTYAGDWLKKALSYSLKIEK